MTLVVNLYGGPGTGKSTTAAGLFSKLKQRGVNCELVTEYAKDKVWDEHYSIFSNQIYIFGKQYHRIHRLLDKVDVIVTDAPLLHSIFYSQNMPGSFKQLVLDVHNSLNTLNIFLTRCRKYNPSGRMQTEEEAKRIDSKLLIMLKNYHVPFVNYLADDSCADVLSRLIEREVCKK